MARDVATPFGSTRRCGRTFREREMKELVGSFTLTPNLSKK
jgi:hypothetical protein